MLSSKAVRSATSGFTLVELAIVVAIIAVLATIALPQFSLMVCRSQEASNKGGLGMVRSALSLYYSDNNGTYTANTNPWVTLTAGAKYMAKIPLIKFPRTPNNVGHPLSGQGVCSCYSSMGYCISSMDQPGAIVVAGFIYDVSDYPCNSPTAGQVFLSCAHRDLKGVYWTSY